MKLTIFHLVSTASLNCMKEVRNKYFPCKSLDYFSPISTHIGISHYAKVNVFSNLENFREKYTENYKRGDTVYNLFLILKVE